MKNFLFSLAIVVGLATLNAQTVLYEDDFESYTAEPNTGEGTQIPSGYTSYDVDGNGYNWGLSNPDFWTQPMGDIYTGNYMISATYLQTGESIQAENILVLPQISIPADASNVTLSYYIGSGTDTGYYAETYEVIVTTENSQAAILAATPVFSETLPSQGGFDRTVNLNAYAGQDVYISFYHTDSFDQWILGLDNISVTADEGEEPSEYCEIITLDCAIEKIDGVTFAGIENLNTGCGTAETNDFTDMVANVEQGGTYDMILDIEADPSFPDDNVFFFIDWNQNGTLDDEGEVYEVVMHTGTSGQYTLAVTVPEDAELGETRLRVGIAYNSGSTFAPIACPTEDNVTYGEYEDYTVNVSGGEEPVDYCDLVTLDCAIEKIDGVTFAGIENLNTGCGTAETNDFTDMVANVEIGGTYDMILDIEADPLFPDDNVFFFIDWNQNGTLDDAGEVYEVVMHTGTSGQYTLAVTVPADAEVGETRLRVGIAYNSGSTFEPVACPGEGTLIYGEYEDYTVNVGLLGVGDVNDASFALYPNPVKDAFKVNLSPEFDAAKISVTVTDLSGKTVKTFGAADSYNVSELPKGVYVVTITDGKNTETKKIVKK